MAKNVLIGDQLQTSSLPSIKHNHCSPIALQDFQLAWLWSQVAIYSDLSTKEQLLSTITIPVTRVCNDKTNFQGARTPCAKFMTEATLMTITTAQCSSIAKLSDRQCSFSSYDQLSPSWCLASWFSASAVTRYNCLLTKQTNFESYKVQLLAY